MNGKFEKSKWSIKTSKDVVALHENLICWPFLCGKACKACQSSNKVDQSICDVVVVPIIKNARGSTRHAKLLALNLQKNQTLRRVGQKVEEGKHECNDLIGESLQTFNCEEKYVSCTRTSATNEIAATQVNQKTEMTLTIIHSSVMITRTLLDKGFRVLLDCDVKDFDACCKELYTNHGNDSAALFNSIRSSVYQGSETSRQTPGARFCFWESQGVSLRVEVGAIEAQNGHGSVAIHPVLSESFCQDLLISNKISLICRSISSEDCLVQPSSSRRPSKSFKIPNLPPPDIASLCQAVLQGRIQSSSRPSDATPTNHSNGNDGGYSPLDTPNKINNPLWTWTHSNPTSNDSTPDPNEARPIPSEWCPKLHIRLLNDNSPSNQLASEVSVCPGHLRRLFFGGKPCFCGRGHASLAALRRALGHAVASRDGEQVVTWLFRGEEEEAVVVEKVGQEGNEEGNKEGNESNHVSDDEADEQVQLLAVGLPLDLDPGAARRCLERALRPLGMERAFITLCTWRAGGSIRPSAKLLMNSLRDVKAKLLPNNLTETVVWISRNAKSGSSPLIINDDDKDSGQEASFPLRISYCSGRADSLFPSLPYTVRQSFRLDSEALYSMTDDALADCMADVIKRMTHWLMNQQEKRESAKGKLGNENSNNRSTEHSDVSMKTGEESFIKNRITPLIAITDATACAGGNAMSFCKVFDYVQAVEIQSERSRDLCYNLDLFLRHHALIMDRKKSKNEASCSDAVAMSLVPQLVEVAVRGLSVYNADCWEILSSVRQDVVFIDAPWGATAYLDSIGDVDSMAILEEEKEKNEIERRENDTKKNMSIKDLNLGEKPLSKLAAELLNGFYLETQENSTDDIATNLVEDHSANQKAARLVALKLPRRGFDFDVFASKVKEYLVPSRPLRVNATARNSGHLCYVTAHFGRSALLLLFILSSEIGACGNDGKDLDEEFRRDEKGNDEQIHSMPSSMDGSKKSDSEHNPNNLNRRKIKDLWRTTIGRAFQSIAQPYGLSYSIGTSQRIIS